MSFPRSSGLLLHPTSLPGAHGIGDLGSAAYRFIDVLARSGQTIWQVLHLGPTGYGDSPYQSFSAFAGNPLLISLDRLAETGLLTAEDLATSPTFPLAVDYGAASSYKLPQLQRAFARFEAKADGARAAAFATFCQEQLSWLDDYALFMALKEAHGGLPWYSWDPESARREPGALKHWRERLWPAIRFHQFLQFLFHEQWSALKVYARSHQIRIIGDMPIFVAHDSADVWANPRLFLLDGHGQPTFVAGVPPDAFSPTGQRWGNPLYDWETLAAQGYHWWIERFRAVLRLVDVVRLDHFLGFVAYWRVPAHETTAVHGDWIPGPGEEFFRAVERALGAAPIIVEDLGLVTPAVEALRDCLGYPGMKVLQFAFGSGPGNPYLPHNYQRNCIVYTGTHDNETTAAWFASRSADERTAILKYLGRDGHDIVWDLIRLALASVADQAIIPLQDLLGLGAEARMNVPGRLGGNWTWRFRPDQITDEAIGRLGELTAIYRRNPAQGH